MRLTCAMSMGVMLVLAGCVQTSPTPSGSGVNMARAATPITPQIHGAGVEAITVHVEASLAEVHEALQTIGGQRDTTVDEQRTGIEVLAMDDAALEPLLRSLHPVDVPSVTWMGFPVRWVPVHHWSAGTMHVRAWPLSLEASEAAAVELHYPPVRRERLVMPGTVLVVVPAGSRWPLPADGRPADTPLAGSLSTPHVQLIVFRPRFGHAAAR